MKSIQEMTDAEFICEFANEFERHPESINTFVSILTSEERNNLRLELGRYLGTE